MKKGFSLIELLVVVAIIGIISVVGILAYLDYIKRTRINATDMSFGDVVEVIKNEYQAFSGGIQITSTYSNTLNINSTCGEYMTAIQSYYENEGDQKNIFDPSLRLIECADSNPNNSTVDSCGACGGSCANVEDLEIGSMLLHCLDGYNVRFIDTFGIEVILNNDV